jgi:hypothetical protein
MQLAWLVGKRRVEWKEKRREDRRRKREREGNERGIEGR